MRVGLPAAVLRGMDDPQQWVQQLSAALPVTPPCAMPQWVAPRDGWVACEWYVRMGSGETVTVLLVAENHHVFLGVWTTAWMATPVRAATYDDLVRTMATLIVDQYAPHDPASVHLHLPSISDLQPPLPGDHGV
jgi:hypothetical protein